jgi:imidazolonepropionase-like amidohydrolase/Tol biopolymer transport system component
MTQCIKLLLLTTILCSLNALSAVEEKSKNDIWDVNHPPYPTHSIKIEVESGTWMNLDVSPDGKEIIFDMLGDLYRMPITGGKAEAITSSIAWEMQPKFSPDGSKIVFTSDAGGGDNIWLMNADGTDQTAITKEKFRLLNNASWSPDGRFVVARKHFTSTRSIGSGELWLYSVNGGSGVRLNKARTKQKDLGEPAFSVDGRYVYFSEDITPGSVFEYSKDSNGIIYGIKRFDTSSGEIESFIRNPGGSVAPTPSPDGKWLAFVQRVRNKSGLFIKNLHSGQQQLLCTCLERDMQETWAIHGVYPKMDWLANSKEVVFWSGGKINRINIETKKVTNIPFKIDHFREVAEALRFENKAYQDKQTSKMLRWVSVSKKQQKVVFQTLGQVYTKNLKTGKFKQLTKGANQAFYPAISRDGKWVTYVSWDDNKLGQIKKISINGGREKIIISEPGHYLEPRFSNDGKSIIYQKTSGGYLFSPDWGLNTGIYSIAASGKGKSKKMNFDGYGIQAADNGKYYFSQVEGSGANRKAKLMMYNNQTAQQQVLAQTHFGTEFSISPDNKWLAYVEGFDVYLAPFRFSGKVAQLSASNAALPVKKISTNAGENIHWSADSETLYWNLGDELFNLDVSSDLFLKNEDDKSTVDKKPLAVSQKIAFEYASDKPSQILALTNARIITMEKDQVIEEGVIIIKDNVIQSVAAKIDAKIPAKAKVIDLSGKTIMPGIIDVHWHGSQGQNEIIPKQNWVNLASLAFGVTTIHDPSNDTSEIFAASELAKSGKIIAPRIFSTGTILYGAKAFIFAAVNSIEDARKHIKRMKAVGAFSVKSYNQPRRDQRQQILLAAREDKILVMPEGGSLFQHNMNMIVDGHSGIEHSIPVANIYDDVKQLWSQTKVAYTPTLIVGYGGIWGENYWYQHTNVWQHPILKNWVPPAVLQPRSIRRSMAPESDYNHFNNAKVATELYELGVETHIGAHGQREGLGSHWEMWMYAQGGMKPMDVLRVATIEGARYLGMDKEIGSLKAGKLADLVVLNVNPLEDIYASDKVYGTMVNGRFFKSDTMEELNGDWKPEPFYWEK